MTLGEWGHYIKFLNELFNPVTLPEEIAQVWPRKEWSLSEGRRER